ncbi:phosphoenolpyruvate synthase [Actinomycetospora corticicola]|uniref:Pyruvate,water dikinase n=1 Tax=Actinomycetospora corticicola TaxID=663602 RepID=A0A7Y9DUA0_9PSEU|nr:phosphoenolpyruvate synthase [Actinomycetospora corticicola]NYD35656.1 pyruvate,water dikinase [Actinomycetospora corticicola]
MTYVLDLHEIDRSRIGEVGGKAANLGALTRIPGVRIPPGSAVTTAAFRRVLAGSPALGDRIARLGDLAPDDRAAIATASTAIREGIVRLPVPDDVAAAIAALASGDGRVAVRSSATAEDLPTASFAGQQDSFLDVPVAEVPEYVRRCWASLFTDRATTYRLRQGIDHRAVAMAVVVQEMVPAEASGVLFTADPVTSHRRTAAVEAVAGLGEALVSGVAEPDRWTVRDGAVLEAPGTGVLTEEQVVALVELGRRIEAALGGPQDIEWCRADGGFAVVQSRPITTLFPVPPVGDDRLHVYVSVGHQQMMTGAMTPLGLSVWQLTTPRPMAEASSRLFVDVTAALASPTGREVLLDVMGRGDPLVRDALESVLARGEIDPAADDGRGAPPAGQEMLDADPAVVAELVAAAQASVATAAREIRARHGADLFAFVRSDLGELRRLLFDPRSHRVFTTAMDAAFWLDEHLAVWLGETHVSDTLTLAVPDDVTSQMGTALLDVADVVRDSPAVVTFLRGLGDDDGLDGLLDVEGGRAAHDALQAFLDAYGARCVGEIDISRPRWADRPATLVPVLLGHVEHAEPGAGARRVQEGRRMAQQKREEVLARLRERPDGEEEAAAAAAMIDRLRTFIGYREYPKFAMIRRYALYRRALWDEAARLVAAGVLDRADDVALLRFDELEDVARTGRVDRDLLEQRRQELAVARTLSPPRVLTSDGEALSGAFRRDDLPPGALAGLPVSRGVVEGRARVVLDLADAVFAPGDVLVTAFTDPSWSPAFVAVAGLVTEVGGTMTHGAVVAREYGLPAVVGVEGATRRIVDGQRIRVDGTNGSVELLGA